MITLTLVKEIDSCGKATTTPFFVKWDDISYFCVVAEGSKYTDLGLKSGRSFMITETPEKIVEAILKDKEYLRYMYPPAIQCHQLDNSDNRWYSYPHGVDYGQ